MMFQKFTQQILFVTLFFFITVNSSVFAVNNYWNGNASDNLWNTAANWSLGTVPVSGQYVYFDSVPAPGANVLIDSTAACWSLQGLGGSSGQRGSLTIQTGGTLTVYIVVFGQNGDASLIINGGTLTNTSSLGYMYMGHDKKGTLQMTSGTANVYKLYLPVGIGTGHIQMDGGTLNIDGKGNNGLLIDYGGTAHAGTIDLTQGIITVKGNYVGTLQAFVNSGNITGYGGTGTVSVIYDSANGVTRISATSTPSAPAYAVTIDSNTGGLIVEGRPFLPIGLFTDWDSTNRIPYEEVVRGFNLITPLWSVNRLHTSTEKTQMQTFLDRCNAIGVKVNYALNLATLQSDATMQSIITDEVQTFRTHSAILSWYIADDPVGNNISTSKLQAAYSLVKQLDPYRPVTIVSMPNAGLSSYLSCFDILMVNPYPIPANPVTYTADTVDSACQLMGGGLTKPVWTSLQAFGGSDGHLREPTIGEMRTQAYLAIAHGSRGIQYFKRREPVGMPKSTLAWNACRRTAMETSMLVPALLSQETSPSITLAPSSIQGHAFLDKGLLTIIAINTVNQPAQLSVQIVGSTFTGQTDVPFEYRQVQVTNGAIAEPIEPHGIRVYQVAVGPIPSDQVSINPVNLTPNPSWETMPNPATPDGCYFGLPQDLAATALLDPITYLNGRRSLRFITPTASQGVLVSPTPVTTLAGSVYRFSVWAKTDQEGTSLWMQAISGTTTQTQTFTLTKNWQEYAITITAETTTMSSNIGYAGPGKAWIDMMQIIPQ